MAELLTLQDLANGHLDVKALGEAANGDENTIVTTRTGKTYPSAERAINIMFQNGGLPATPFETKALMTASSLVDGDYAVVTDDSVKTNNGLWQLKNSSWQRSAVNWDNYLAILHTHLFFQGDIVVQNISSNETIVRTPNLMLQQTSKPLKHFYEPEPVTIKGPPHYVKSIWLNVDTISFFVSDSVTEYLLPDQNTHLLVGYCMYGEFKTPWSGNKISYSALGKNSPVHSAGPILYERSGNVRVYIPSQIFEQDSLHTSISRNIKEGVETFDEDGTSLGFDGAVYSPTIMGFTDVHMFELEFPLDIHIYYIYMDIADSKLRVAKHTEVYDDTSNLGRIMIATVYRGMVRSFVGQVEDITDLTAPNIIKPKTLVPFGKSIITEVDPVIFPDVIDMGYTEALISIKKDTEGDSAWSNYSYIPVVDPVPSSQSYVVVEFYIAKPADAPWIAGGSLRQYLWTIGGDTPYPYINSSVSVIEQVTENVRKYRSSAIIPAGVRLDRVASGFEDTRYGHIIFGLSAAIDNKPFARIGEYDYPELDYNLPQNDFVETLRTAIRSFPIPYLQQPIKGYTTKVTYGQSLGSGNESYPSLSKENKYGNLMLGDNVRPAALDGVDYPVFGSLELKPLRANVVSAAGNVLLTDEQAAALANVNQAVGEPVDIGFVNSSKYYLNRKLFVGNAEDYKFVVINPSVSGRTINQLSKNNEQDSIPRYNRLMDGIAKVHGVATADGSKHVVDSLIWMQGEYDYTAGAATMKTRAEYRDKLLTFFDDAKADILTKTGQELPPAMFTYQTGAAYTGDNNHNGTPELHVGQAQNDTSNMRPDIFMVGPIYPVTDKGAHLDSNGCRWYGNQMAKVYKQVVLEGKNWSPLQPIKTTTTGKKVVIDFYVPHPPLKVLPQFLRSSGGMSTDYGFKLTNSSGEEIAITSVEILPQSVVITTAVELTAEGILVWYGSQKTSGGGNLCDSDPTISPDLYEYLPDSGMYPEANIPSLVNKPYPLNNWCVAFVVNGAFAADIKYLN